MVVEEVVAVVAIDAITTIATASNRSSVLILGYLMLEKSEDLQ